jgi:hypothetical protein
VSIYAQIYIYANAQIYVYIYIYINPVLYTYGTVFIAYCLGIKKQIQFEEGSKMATGTQLKTARAP